jgi:hypothetical protein
LEHVRIDEGIKRPRKQRQGPRLPTLKTAVTYHPAKLANIDVQDVIGRYLNGESSVQIATGYGVTRQGLAFHLRKHAEDDWREAQIVQAIERKELAQDGIDTAEDALSLARAREQLRAAQWDLERLFSRLYGPKQEVTHNLPNGPLISITLSPGLSVAGTTHDQPHDVQVIDNDGDKSQGNG